MSERRRLRRKHLLYYLKVYDRHSLELIGHLGDITLHGINLITEAPIEPGIEMSLKMSLPEVMEGRKEIAFDVKSSWYKRDINPNFYSIGCELLKISETDGNIVKNLIQEYSFQE